MTNTVRRPNRFLRPKRDYITPLDRIQGKLRSLIITGKVLLTDTHAKVSKRTMALRRRERASATR